MRHRSSNNQYSSLSLELPKFGPWQAQFKDHKLYKQGWLARAFPCKWCVTARSARSNNFYSLLEPRYTHWCPKFCPRQAQLKITNLTTWSFQNLVRGRPSLKITNLTTLSCKNFERGTPSLKTTNLTILSSNFFFRGRPNLKTAKFTILSCKNLVRGRPRLKTTNLTILSSKFFPWQA